MGQRSCFSSQVVIWVYENGVVQPGDSLATAEDHPFG